MQPDLRIKPTFSQAVPNEKGRGSVRVSVAPMVDRTDRHFRWMMRQISKSTWLYTEMEPAPAVLAHPQRIALDRETGPVVLQLGGSDAKALRVCARWAEDAGYTEINLNCGCPSNAATSGRFGARLMLEPPLVAECVAAMRAEVKIPITVKHRIGVDDHDRYEDMLAFVDAIEVAGCRRFIVHARKGWLQGLSPRENRTIPPLRHHDVHRLKRERPHLQIEVNGGLTVADISAHAELVDGVMIGRAAYDDPLSFAGLDGRLDSSGTVSTIQGLVDRLTTYIAEMEQRGEPIHRITRHTLPLFRGRPGGRGYRRILSAAGSRTTLDTFREACSRLDLGA